MNDNQLDPLDRRYAMIFLDHSQRYPAWRVEDLYKLIHQGSMGSEHAVVDRAHAQRWLENELAQMGNAEPEPLLDPISADGEIVRVHLRPLMEAKYPPAALLDAFITTSTSFHGSSGRLEESWRQAVELAAQGKLAFTPDELEKFFEGMRELGYPAVHHSTQFENRYHPAYRVVARRFLPVEWVARFP